MPPSLASTKLDAQSLSVELEELLLSYADELCLQRRRSPNTQRSYLQHARCLVEFAVLHRSEPSRLQNLFDGELLRDHVRECSQTLGASSQAQKASALRAFLNFLHRRGVLETDLSRHLERPKVPKKLTKVLSEDLLLDLRQALERHPPHERLLFELLYGSGLRISEAKELSWKDHRPSLEALEILGKGKKRRVAPLTPQAAELLVRLKARKPARSTGPFPQNVRTLRRWVSSWALLLPEASLELHPHLLRHSLATHLLQRGAKLPQIQRILGHRRLSTTERYTHLDLNDLIRAYEGSFASLRSPRKALKKS
jgi:integrase/recombinase XerC